MNCRYDTPTQKKVVKELDKKLGNKAGEKDFQTMELSLQGQPLLRATTSLTLYEKGRAYACRIVESALSEECNGSESFDAVSSGRISKAWSVLGTMMREELML